MVGPAMAVALLMAAACSDDDDVGVPATSTVPPSTVVEGPLDHDDPPASYRVTYRVERFAAATPPVVDTEVRIGRLPFEARVERRPGEPADAAPPRSVDLQVLGGYETAAPGQTPVLLVVAPEAPAGSAIVGVDWSGLQRLERVELTDVERVIADRPCRVVRTAAPLGEGELSPPTAARTAESCVAADGLLLQEIVEHGGEVVRRKTATDVDDEPDLDATTFEPNGRRLPGSQGGGRVRRVTDDSRPPDTQFFQLPAPPRGFTHHGRYGIAFDRPTTITTEVLPPLVVSLADVYVAGPEVITIENGGTDTGAPALSPDGGTAVEVAGFPTARLLVHAHQYELRLLLDDDRFVRVAATIPLADLIDVAESLEPISGPAQVQPYDDDEDITDRLAD